MKKTPPEFTLPPEGQPALKTHEIAVGGKRTFDPASAVDKSVMRMIEAETRRIMDVPDSNPNTRRFPEHLFRRNFLPIISGEAYRALPEGKTAEELHEEATGLWLNIAGSMYAEVDVVDGFGKVVFTMPALADTSGLNTTLEVSDPGLASVTENYHRKISGLPEFAARDLTVGLNRKLLKLLSNPPGEKQGQSKMDKIRDYYGLNDLKKEEEQQKKAAEPDDLGDMSFD